MKKIVLFALVLATVAVAASAQTPIEPRWNATYRCDYQNYSGNASDPGYSTWHNPTYYFPGGSPLPLIRAKETFTTSYGTDTYNCSWAKPSTPSWGYPTTWEFTFNPYGPQCKKAVVSAGAFSIAFSECTDGHTRTCTLVY